MSEQQLILEDVSWDTYGRLLADTGPERRKRLTYDDGTLQIVVPSWRRERPNCLLESIMGALTDEWAMDMTPCGSMTVLRADLRKGFEADSCFYIHNAGLMRRRKDELDFAVDPPPDLVIDVQVTRDSVQRLPIFAAFGVPEVWRYDQDRAAIYVLDGGTYVEAGSALLAPLTAELLTSFLQAGLEEARPQWLRRLRQWASSVTRS